jgi:hypothetical protein
VIAEITGGRQRAFDTLEITGMNAALGIDDVQDKIEYLVKGFRAAINRMGFVEEMSIARFERTKLAAEHRFAEVPIALTMSIELLLGTADL